MIAVLSLEVLGCRCLLECSAWVLVPLVCWFAVELLLPRAWAGFQPSAPAKVRHASPGVEHCKSDHAGEALVKEPLPWMQWTALLAALAVEGENQYCWSHEEQPLPATSSQQQLAAACLVPGEAFTPSHTLQRSAGEVVACEKEVVADVNDGVATPSHTVQLLAFEVVVECEKVDQQQQQFLLTATPACAGQPAVANGGQQQQHAAPATALQSSGELVDCEKNGQQQQQSLQTWPEFGFAQMPAKVGTLEASLQPSHTLQRLAEEVEFDKFGQQQQQLPLQTGQAREDGQGAGSLVMPSHTLQRSTGEVLAPPPELSSNQLRWPN